MARAAPGVAPAPAGAALAGAAAAATTAVAKATQDLDLILGAMMIRMTTAIVSLGTSRTWTWGLCGAHATSPLRTGASAKSAATSSSTWKRMFTNASALLWNLGGATGITGAGQLSIPAAAGCRHLARTRTDPEGRTDMRQVIHLRPLAPNEPQVEVKSFVGVSDPAVDSNKVLHTVHEDFHGRRQKYICEMW